MLEDLQRGHEGLIVKLNDVIRALKVRQQSILFCLLLFHDFNSALNCSAHCCAYTFCWFFNDFVFQVFNISPRLTNKSIVKIIS